MLATILDAAPTWVAITVAVVTYVCVGALAIVGFVLAALRLESFLERRQAITVTSDLRDLNVMQVQERIAARDLGYRTRAGR